VLACILYASTISACIAGHALQAAPRASQPTQSRSAGASKVESTGAQTEVAGPAVATTPTKAGAQSVPQTMSTPIPVRLAATAVQPPHISRAAPPTADPADRVDSLLKQLEGANNTADPLDDLSKP
jgi:hypothetical protein